MGYKVVNAVTKTATGLEAKLQLKASAKNAVKWPQVENLTFEAIYLTDKILRIKITDTNNKRYEVPIQKDFPLLQNKVQEIKEEDRKYTLEVNNSSETFGFSVTRKDSKTKM